MQNREVYFKDITNEKAIYAVQGPKSRDVLNNLLKDSIDDLKTFEFINTTINDIEVMVSRTGFTGELGYELHFDPKPIGEISDKIKEAGQAYGIKELVTDVTLNSLPGEKGYITDSDFLVASPIELGLGWTVNCEKYFIGKERVCMEKEQGPERNLLGFAIKDTDMDQTIEIGKEIKLDDQVVGKVTTIVYSYSFEKLIGYVLVDREVEIGDRATLVTKGRDLEAILQDRVFYDSEGEKLKGEKLSDTKKRLLNE